MRVGERRERCERIRDLHAESIESEWSERERSEREGSESEGSEKEWSEREWSEREWSEPGVDWNQKAALTCGHLLAHLSCIIAG